MARAAVSVGFRKFRLTGGEPTLRADLLEIVARLARIPGVARPRHDDERHPPAAPRGRSCRRPACAGSTSTSTASIPSALARVMRWGTLAEIWAGIEAAEAAGFAPIKLNAVVVRDFNEDDVVPLAALTLERTLARALHRAHAVRRRRHARVARSGLVPQRADPRAHRGGARPADAAAEPLDPSDESRNHRLPGRTGRGRLHQSR